MKVMITGATGQLARSLVERGQALAGLDLVPCGRPCVDLERPEGIAAAVRDIAPDVIVNAAAFTDVEAAEGDPERATLVNAVAAGSLAQAAAAQGARLIQLSTDYVFDGEAAAPYREDAPTAPLNAYGRSKLEGERRVRAASEDHLIVRTSWLYSPFGRNFVRTIIAAARVRDLLEVVDDQRGSPTSALDLADALLLILRAWSEGSCAGLGETLHIAGSDEVSWFELAEAILVESARLGLATAAVRPIGSSQRPSAAVRPRYSVLSCSRYEALFGAPLPPLRSSLAEVVGRIGAEHGR